MSQIQKSTDRSLMDDAIALTAATPTQIESFLNQHTLSLAQLLEDEVALELLAQQATQPNSLHDARAKIEPQLEEMEVRVDAHLSQWEDARAKRIAARLGAVPTNVTRKINEHLGGLSADADGFLAQLYAAFPLD
jgi:phage shock protein A